MISAPFVPIFAPEVLAMPIAECGERLADARNLEGIVLSDRYAEDWSSFFVVRLGVFERLRAVQRQLPQNVHLMFAEALRPLAVQRALQEKVKHQIALAHPEWSPAQVDAETALYVAPPDAAPPHSTGGAVDVTLADADGNELSMGSALNSIGPASHAAFQPLNITERNNRALLRRLMSSAGFVNYDGEWWHWSYGDRYWALRTEQPASIYGAVESNPLLLTQLNAMRARPNA
jgi:zinc D-Ala-D-Ala dipeptidase